MPEQSLAQVLAVERGIRQNENAVSGELHKNLQRSAAFQGETRTYRVLKEGGLQQPDVRTQVVSDALQFLTDYREVRGRAIDVTLTKDVSNRDASADLVVDGVTLATDVPAVTLLSLTKVADDIIAFVQALPVLDPTEKWVYDQNAGCFRSEPSHQLRGSKETVALVLWEPADPATSKHPAQVDKIIKDVPVGEWTITKFSSALPAAYKRELLKRATAFREAVRKARVEANRVPATERVISPEVFGYLFPPAGYAQAPEAPASGSRE